MYLYADKIQINIRFFISNCFKFIQKISNRKI